MEWNEAANWVDQQGGLPSYIKRIEKHLERKGMSKSHAIATAVNVAKKMCATGDVNWPGSQQVNAGSRAEACAAVARWEQMKAAAGESARNQMEAMDAMTLSEVAGDGVTPVADMLGDLPKLTEVTEATGFGEALRGPSGAKMRARLISPGWGSSGYYSESLLKETAAKGLFGPGTHMYLDHPTSDQNESRPERSIRDLAGVISSSAVYSGDGVYADIEVFPPFREALSAMKDHIGVSIRALGMAEQGEADGRTGTIISELSEIKSVDFVTRAGRGGQITALLESAREVEEASDKPWSDFTQADYSDSQWARACLVHRAGETGKSAYSLPVREPSGALNRNAVHAAAARLNQLQPASLRAGAAAKLRALYKQLGEEPPASLSGGAKKESTTTGGPVSGTETQGTPAGGTPTTVTENKPEGQMQIPGTPAVVSEADKKRISDLEKQLAEARATAEIRSDVAHRAAESERLLAEAQTKIARLSATETARSKTQAALAESKLPDVCAGPVIARVLGHEGALLPLTEANALDDAKLTEAIKAAVKAEETYVAQIAEALGVGTPTGLGETKAPQMDDKQFQESLAGLLQGTGMDEKTATAAAKGR
jgi:hypothetical protein